MQLADVDTAEAPPEEEGEADVGPKKRPYKKSYRTRGAAAVERGVQMQVFMPRRVHDELKRAANRTRMTMPRLLIETFVESLHPELAMKLREDMGPIASSQRRLEAGLRSSLRAQRLMCPICRKTHENMPGPGPWHMPDCGWYRTRPSVMVDGEKE